MKDALYTQLMEQARAMTETINGLAAAETPRRPPGNFEPPVATAVRNICRKLLEASNAQASGDCPLCDR